MSSSQMVFLCNVRRFIVKRVLCSFLIACIIFVVVVDSTSAYFGNTSASIIKKSTSGICHDSHSPYYLRTQKYEPFDTLKACVASGGYLPKGHKLSHSKNDYSDKSATETLANDSNGYSKSSYTTELTEHDSRTTTYTYGNAQNLTVSRYNRNQFGSGWADLDKNCRNSRMETLASQSVLQVQYKSSKNCKVVRGKWISPFTGNIIYDASKIDIDHIVPLSWAWKHGAYKWNKDNRIKFANDPANLLSVEARHNRKKGDKGLDKWLPPKNQCQYILRFKRVLKLYDLPLTKNEKSRYKMLKERHCS